MRELLIAHGNKPTSTQSHASSAEIGPTATCDSSRNFRPRALAFASYASLSFDTISLPLERFPEGEEPFVLIRTSKQERSADHSDCPGGAGAARERSEAGFANLVPSIETFCCTCSICMVELLPG